MKWLIVMEASAGVLKEEQRNQCNAVTEMCTDYDIRLDSYVYSENAIDPSDLKTCVSGVCYYEDNAQTYPEAAARRIKELQDKNCYEGILVAEGAWTAEIVGLTAAEAGSRAITGIYRMEPSGGNFLFYKQVYQYNMEAAFRLNVPFTAGLAQWKKAEEKGRDIKCSQMIRLTSEKMPDFRIRRILKEQKMCRQGADILIAAGKGVRSKEEINQIRKLAERKGYLFGVSRPVAMNGWAGIDEIIGVSGHLYAPRITITIGVSGSAAFYAGIENSSFIMSVNSDEKAPIIKLSDVSVINDYAEVWERWLAVL